VLISKNEVKRAFEEIDDVLYIQDNNKCVGAAKNIKMKDNCIVGDFHIFDDVNRKYSGIATYTPKSKNSRVKAYNLKVYQVVAMKED